MIKKTFVALVLLATLCMNVFADATSPEPASSRTPDIRRSEISRGDIRAIHMTGAAAASKKYREKLYRMLDETVINAVVIDIKEETGFVYIPNVAPVLRVGAYQPIMSDWNEWLKELHDRGVYTVARIVVKKDNIYPRKNPKAAVKNTHGEIWFDRTKTPWLDPFSEEARTYNLLIALEAAKLGFQEIQYDYIRFPTDGMLGMMRFSQPYTRAGASDALVTFLRKSKQLLSPMNVKVSIDVFGLTTSDMSGMGIGQQLGPMAEHVDYVYPMVYPSHYNPGEYGLAVPNDSPYETISYAMRDAKKVLGPDARRKLRPWLQDFSLKGRGKRYTEKEVRAQIQAAADQGIHSWALWNARCSYTWDALRTVVSPAASTAPAVPVTSETPVDNPSK